MKKSFFSSCLKAAATVLLAFAVASCAQSAGGDDEGTVSGAPAGGNAANVRRVGISIAGDKKQSGPALLIMPEVDPDVSKYSYKLTGTSARGTTIEKDILITAFDTPVDVELAATYWELTLTAYLGGDAALRGVRAVDLTNGSQNISFTLTPGNIEGGTGSVEVSGTFVLNPNAKRYVVGLYKMNTMEDVVVGTAEEVVIDGTASANKFTFEQDGYEPGEYVFKFTMFNAETDGDIISEYSDLIIVNSGICTKAVIEIPDLNRVPAAPDNFKAMRLNSSITDDTDSFYDVEFTWDDKSSNEKYFELVLTEYDTDGTVKGKQTLPIAAAGDTDKPFASVVSGSLNACNESCTIRLPTGRLFDATIKAKTSRGSQGYVSEEVKRSDSSGGTAADKTGFASPDSGCHINTVRRVYDLNGGTLKLSGETEERIGIYYEFKVYEGTDIPLLTVGSVAGGGNLLSLPIAGSADTIAFDGWIDTADGKKVAADYIPTACKDGSYKAKFKSNSISIASITGYEDLADGKVAVNGTPVEKNTAVEIEQKEDKDVELDFKDPDGDFVSYLFKMDGALLSDGSSHICKFNSTAYDAGLYNMLVIGVARDGTAYSLPFVLNLKR